MFERVIIATGSSNRQTKALAASVRDSVKSRGMQVMATEGEDNGEWIIVDCGAAVAHIMQPAIREYYHLEEIWGGKNVRMKVGEVNTKLVKASEPEPAPRRAASKSSAAAAPAGKPAAKPPARKAAAKKLSPAAAAAQKAANRTAAGKRVATTRPAARKSAAAKPAAKPAAKAARPAAKTASRAPARKTPAR
jgi:ribosome-associated protein